MKRQNYQSKSHNIKSEDFSEVTTITILLSQNRKIFFDVQYDIPLCEVKSLLFQKIKELEQMQIIGFESTPSNYLFDYRLSKNIGVLGCQWNGNLTLKCLYKISTNYFNTQEKYPRNKDLKFFSSSIQKICKYKICKPLSSGGFSRVYLVRNLQNGQFYAAKFMDKSSQVNIDRQQAIRNQFYIHKSLDHPYIVKMEQYIETQYFYILILEYCPGGELFTVLKNNRYMGEEKAKIIFIQVLLAIKYLHDRNIVFRDIKPENILIDSKGNAKLTDFGLAKQIRGKTNSYCGSVQYMAPQIVSKHSYSFDVDLYCMGALLYEILIGCPPFYNPNFSNSQTKYHICNSQVSFPSKIPLSDEVKYLIADLLTKNPNERLGHLQGVNQILQHQWIESIQIQDYLKHRVKNPFIPHLDVENFDRQQDQYELNFRKKILQDIRNSKRIINSNNIIKQRNNSHIKSKSQSFAILQQKNLKSKSQQDFIFKLSNKKSLDLFKIKTFSKKLISNIQNPYAFQIKNKSISQIYSKSKDKKEQFVNQTNGFKKKKQQRALSRSLNKTTTGQVKNFNDPENEAKICPPNFTLVNSKSCGNSRKSSLYKKSSQGSFSKFSNLTSYKYKINSHNYTKSFTDSIKGNQVQKSKSKPSTKNPVTLLDKQQVFLAKQTKEKQNLESKGLKKNALKKKFMFSTTKQSSSGFIKNNHFKFEVVNSEQKNGQNRQTVV